MILDFETACLSQKFDLRDGQRQFGCAGLLLVHQSLVSQFVLRIDFSVKEFN